MGLPPLSEVDGDEAAELALTSGSSAEVVDDAREPDDYYKALSYLINAQAPGITLPQRLDLCGRAMTAIMRESIPGADAFTYKRANQMGPVDAKNIYTYLKAHPEAFAPGVPQNAGVAQEAAAKEEPAKEAAPAVEVQTIKGGVTDEPDWAEAPPMEESEALADEPDRSASTAYTAFMAEVLRARPKLPKIAGKQPVLISEFPSLNCGKWWLNSTALAAVLVERFGIPSGKALLLYDHGDVKVSAEVLDTLTEALREMVKKVGAK
jgi:hypothetical protein